MNEGDEWGGCVRGVREGDEGERGCEEELVLASSDGVPSIPSGV